MISGVSWPEEIMASPFNLAINQMESENQI